MTLTDVDWCAAACADARVEKLSMQAIECAYDVAKTPEEFFIAISASITLKGICDGRLS
jgi:hypothetical protein